MKKRSRNTLLLLMLSVVLVLSACGSKGNTPAANTGSSTGSNTSSGNAPKGGIAVYSVNTDVMTFWDPSDSFSNEIIAMHNMYETLLRYNAETKSYDKLLAEDYSKSEDGLTWTFKLRKGVKFHTGAELSADLVKKSIERTIKRGKGASYIWEAVKEINVVDQYTVEFKLKYAAALDSIVSAGYSAFIFDADALDQHGEDWINQGNDAGSGPYTVQKWTKGSELVLTDYPEYWKGWQPKNFEKVVFKTTPEANTRVQQLESGEVDITNQLTPEMLKSLDGKSGVQVLKADAFQNLTLQINTLKAPFNTPKARQALAYAINYDSIVKDIMGGMAEQSTGYLPKGLWGQDPSLFKYSYNPEKAKELLKEAGVTGGKLSITYLSGDDTERQVAELLKVELAKVGVDLEIKGMTWDAQWDLAKSPDASQRQDLFLLYYWSGYSDPYGYLSIAYKTENPIVYNLGYYSNTKFDDLIDQARKNAGADRDGAAALYKQAQEILINDVPGISIFDLKYGYGLRDNFKGFSSNPYYANVVFFYDTYRE
ncbi:ABC transporter substrate-binding protein [Paenibacillus sp. GCM10012306]|uniref:ABC transporter substrate-binding protein n=1 Tax=Paenibacillus sp. GCM10012306 TaxID=3317342 RepID=UPI00361D8D2D